MGWVSLNTPPPHVRSVHLTIFYALTFLSFALVYVSAKGLDKKWKLNPKKEIRHLLDVSSVYAILWNAAQRSWRVCRRKVITGRDGHKTVNQSCYDGKLGEGVADGLLPGNCL